MDATLPNQPLNNWTLFKLSLRYYRAGLKSMLALSFLLSITVFIPRIISVLIGQDLFLNMPPLSPHRLWLICIDLVALMFFIGMIWHMHCFLTNIREPMTEDLRVGIKKLIAVTVACIIQSGIIFGVSLILYGMLALFNSYNVLFQFNTFGLLLTTAIFVVQLILMLYVATLFFFTVPLIAVENNHILTALERSVLLGWNHWWRIFSLQILPWVIYVLILFFIKSILHIDIHIYFIEHGTHTIWSTLLHIILFALFMPWVATLLLVQLNDLELRKDKKIS